MSKKHYIKLAEMIRTHLQKADRPGGQETVTAIRMLAEDLSELCGDDNPNFDPARFLKACGID